jgi:Flp pilus assembly protein TadG
VAIIRGQESNQVEFPAADSGQALIEFAFCAAFLIIVAFGVVDLGHGIYVEQVVTNLTGEGSSLASRGTSLSDSAAAVVAAASPLDISGQGKVIVSSVFNNNNVLQLSGQATSGKMNVSSRVGNVIGGTAVVPAAAKPQLNQTMYVTEIFYPFQSVTPLGTLLSMISVPAQVYDVAYY